MRNNHAVKEVLRILVLLLVLPCASPAIPQAVATPESEPVTAELLGLKINEVEASTTLDEQAAGILLDLYRRALTQLEASQVEQAAADALAQAAAQAPKEIDRIRGMLETATRPSPETLTAGWHSMPLEELEQRLTREKARLAEAQARLGTLNEEVSSQLLRPAMVRERLTQARNERDAVAEELKSTYAGEESPEVAEARRWEFYARGRRLAAEVQKLEQETLTHDVRQELLVARQELADLDLERTRYRVSMLEEIIGKRRTADAERVRQEAVTARDNMEDESPAVRALAASNVSLGDQLAQQIQDIQAAAVRRDSTQRQVTRIDREMIATKSKLEIAGLKHALGRMLLEQRRDLPSLRSLEKQRDDNDMRIADVGLEGIVLEEQRRALRDREGFAEDVAEDLPPAVAADARDELMSLAEARVELVEKAIDANTQYLRVLGELDLALTQLADIVGEYGDFLESRLLWQRTTTRVGVRTLRSVPDDVAWLLKPANWRQFVRDLITGFLERPLVPLLIAGLLALGFTRPRILRNIDASARGAGRFGIARFSRSIEALIYTLLAALPLPLLLVLSGRAVSSLADAAEFSAGTASAMMEAGLELLLIRFFLEGCRPGGLLELHCGWSNASIVKLRSELRWIQFVYPATILVAGASSRFEETGVLGGLELLATLLGAGALAVLIFRLFMPGGGILKSFLDNRSTSLLAQSRAIWIAALVAVMPLLVALGISGYSYTADVLATGFMNSFWVVLGLTVLQGLLARWLLLGSQRLEYEAALERWAASRSDGAEAGADRERTGGPEEADFEVQEPRIDYAALNKDSRTLLKAIMFFAAAIWLWLIWAPIIPALGILEGIPLWSHTEGGGKIQVPVTLADLLLAVVLGVATGAAAKGLPALVEMALLRRTSITQGGRYAVSTLLRYMVIGTGAVVIIGLLGVTWSKAQWLVAALGVGIGLGLQEIVANFVSGLVILFERPVRVGDAVTVGDTSGVVTRIQIRATTIRDWDRREMLVPNKELITSRLLNWSLSDDVIRIVIPIGIAYDSDVLLAMKLAEEAAREHEEVLADPAPFVIFDGFGESALKLSLRAYLPSIENRFTTMSELHQAIRRKFRDAGLEFAFPQRDIHLHATAPLDVRVRSEED